MVNTRFASWDSIFKFGRHAGKTVKQVYDVDPRYLLWCYENVSSFIPDEELEKIILDIL